MNNLKSDEKKCEESVIEDNGVWRWEQLRTRGGNWRKGKFSTERRHKETEPNRARGKTFTGAGKREVWIQKRESRREKDVERESGGKEGQTGRWKVLWWEGVFMSGSRRRSGAPSKSKPRWSGEREREREKERQRESGCLKDVRQNKEPKIAPLDCPENHILKMNFRTAPNNL